MKAAERLLITYAHARHSLCRCSCPESGTSWSVCVASRPRKGVTVSFWAGAVSRLPSLPCCRVLKTHVFQTPPPAAPPPPTQWRRLSNRQGTAWVWEMNLYYINHWIWGFILVTPNKSTLTNAENSTWGWVLLWQDTLVQRLNWYSGDLG